MELLFQIFSAFLLGFIGGATPGPMMASSFTESLRKGFLSSFRVIFKALIAETIVILFILALFFLLHIPQIAFAIISIIGVAVLIYLALQIWKIRKINSEGEIFTFKKIFLMALFNGPFLIFWITVGVPQAFLLKEKVAGGQFLFLLLFELGWFTATTLLTFIFSRFRPLLTKGNFISIVFKILALILLFFAVKLIIESIKLFSLQ